MAVIIWDAGAPAKTKNDGCIVSYIFSGKGLTFSASCKTSEHSEFYARRKIRSVNAKHIEHIVRGAKRINTTAEGKEDDYGTDKKEWSEINRDWRICVWQMEEKSTARI